MKPPEELKVEGFDLRGLELKREKHSRIPTSFRKLENIDLIIPGAVRKSLGLKELINKIYDFPIKGMRSFRRTPTDSLVVVGVDSKAQLWDLETGIQLAASQVGVTTTRPFVAAIQAWGIKNFVSDVSFVPVIYLVYIVDDGTIYKWDPNYPFGPTPVGFAGPEQSAATYVSDVGVSNNPQIGISILVSRRYRYTYYNQFTNHESSPSFDNTDFPDRSGVFPNTTSPDFPYFTMMVMQGVAPVNITGYNAIKLYATRDGGSEFFQVKNFIVYVPSAPIGSQWFQSTEDGIALLGGLVNGNPINIIDGVRDPNDAGSGTYPGALSIPEPIDNGFTKRQPVNDAVLVIPGPSLNENDPPPLAVWGAVYQGRLWLIVKDNQSQIVFSKIRDFNSFPPENQITFESDEFDPVITMDAQYTQLVIGKLASTQRITGTDFTDFFQTPLDKQTGIVGRRALADISGVLMFLSKMGLERFVTDVPEFFGQDIKEITDLIPESSKLNDVLAAVDDARGVAIFSYKNGSDDKARLIMIDVSQESPFSTFVAETPLGAIEGDVTGLDQVEVENGNERVVLIAIGDRVYKLFGEDGVWTFNEEGEYEILPLVSTIEFQILPIELETRRHVFHRFYAIGSALNEWTISYSWNEGVSWTDERMLRPNNYVGFTGRNVVVRLKNSTLSSLDLPDRPSISGFTLKFVNIGQGIR